MSDSAAKALALAALAYKGEHASGNYPDIANKPKLNNVTINGSHNSAYYKLPLLAETGHSITFTSDSEYNLTIALLNKDGDIISSDVVDLPLESVVMDGEYKETSEGKWLVLTLQNGNKIEIPLDDLIDELATKEYVDSLYEDLSNRIDSEASIREEQVIILRGLIDSEGRIRQENDDAILLALDSEAEIRLVEDTNLKNLLDSEAAIRENQYNELRTDLDSEAQFREEEDLHLAFLINSEGEIREAQFAAFRRDFDAEVAARISGDSELRADLNMETFLRTQGDLDLQSRLDSEALIREAKDSQLESLLGNEALTRSNQDIALSNRINQKQDIISTSTPLVKLGNVIQLNYDPNTLSIEDNALKVIGGGGGSVQAYLNGVLLDSEATSIDAKIYWYGTSEQYAALSDSEKSDGNTLFIVEGENDPLIQTTTYNRLVDKPSINGQTLSGDKSLASLGIQPTMNGTNPIRVAGNNISLAYNEEQFYIGADNKLFYYDKVAGFVPDITFINNFQGIYGGINVNKYASGLYSGSIRFLSTNALTAGTEYKVANAFGDNSVSVTFNSYALGFDDLTYTPMCVRIDNGEVYIYPTINIPARGIIGFSFLASV